MPKPYECAQSDEWVHLPRDGMKLACCDCWLTHDISVKVDHKGRIWLRTARNENSTAKLRKFRGLNIKK